MSRIKDQLKEIDVRPSKNRGQNFIKDSSVTEGIAAFGKPQSNEKIVEIGPGLGALTAYLTGGKELILIEIEKSFAEQLQLQYPSAKVFCADIREFDLSHLGDNLTVFGNLPYVYSSEIIFKLIANRHLVKRAVILLQREFVERLIAKPGGRDYGSLSVAVQLWADLTPGPIIPGDVFHPPTKVESQLVEVVFFNTPRVVIPTEKFFERVVRASFSQRRKKLRNSLSSTGFWSIEKIDAALESTAIDGGRRAETLNLEEFSRLSFALQ